MARHGEESRLGSRMSATELVAFMEHVFAANLAAEAQGLPKTPLCIWGAHGIGKTETVEALARALGWGFAYLAPAQFEEMGDLLGMPRIDEAGRTAFAAPEWVPRDDGPGILLVDDLNRADGRILRGLMQLLQRHETMSWRLPPRWQIVATANPEGGDYAVSALDPAMLTRMLHATLVFDVRSWATWAEGASLDRRGIAFVLAYPELVGSERTTPRSLVQLFRLLGPIEDWRASEELVARLAEACLDREAATALVGFLRRGDAPLPTPEEVLLAEDLGATVLPRIARMLEGEQRALDALLMLCARLAEAAARVRPRDAGRAAGNLKAFVLSPLLPPDVRLVLARELSARGGAGKRLLADPEVARLLLGQIAEGA
jgi:MoxR-like ATPase